MVRHTAIAILVVLFGGLLVGSPAAAVAHPPYIDDPKLTEDGPWLYVRKQERADSFRQLEEILPTPNDQRTASGAPGPKYWQQRASHHIKARLDETNQRLDGWERVRYENHSPDELAYLWLQLDQNRFRWSSTGELAENAPDLSQRQSIGWLRGIVMQQAWEGGYRIAKVSAADGSPLPYSVVDTMMRIDLPTPLKPGATIEFEIEYSFPILNSKVQRGRSCYELLPETDYPIYEIAQWFPRLAPYTDVNGWQHKQFLGSGEFTLEFGDYEVEIDVPDHYVVAAPGELQNPDVALTAAQRERLATARSADTPTFVVTHDEAVENQKRATTGRKVWRFRAENVRDFAWAASPTFVWDAMAAPVSNNKGQVLRTALAMSFYPTISTELWHRFSTQAVAHTIDTYSRHAYPYPYPVAISVNGPVGGMEYPMISFNGPRPEKDGTWSRGAKYGLVSVVIHEVGHNWFPMIINSDERQWTWMDEGLNTFMQYLAEQEWEAAFESGRGEPAKIVGHMTSAQQTPIMTNSESVLQFGPSQYGKPATALNILRESVLGREQFDFAMREYCRRWAFKRPEPADFFRTIEDASGVDLDWFWRGWFYSTDHVDVSVERVVTYRPKGLDVEADKAFDRERRSGEQDVTLSAERNAALPKRDDRYADLKDFYSTFDELEVTPQDRRAYERFLRDLEADELAALKTDLHFTIVRFRNLGGLVSFLPVELTFDDGSTQFLRLPAELWTRNSERASKLFVTEKPVVKVELDPKRETADADRANNAYPQEIRDERFAIEKGSRERNPMQRARDEERRSACQRIAKALAPEFLALWNEAGVKAIAEGKERPTPLALASELGNRARTKGLLEAPRGNSIHFEFADASPKEGEAPKEVRFATVILEVDAPRERGVERPDPVRFLIHFDGSVRPDDGR
ncbi:MAG: M1 family metallopeptidase [Phycisphaerae bacterium]|nr:M1 family metallopeptidase [Phycisphaerae bacterium]